MNAFISEVEASNRVAEWKDDAKRIGATQDHSKEVIVSLFDRTGVWSQPWVDAGYTVLRYDLAHSDDLCRSFPVADLLGLIEEGFKFKGVLAAPPCTSFSSSGARWWKTQHDRKSDAAVEKKYGRFASRYFDRPIDYATALVDLTRLVVEITEPEFYAIENPIGRFARMNNLSKPRLVFDPHYYGSPYTKRTQLFGEFNADLPTANVAPRLGSLVHKLRGDDPEQKSQRSVTPEGFAYAFFEANKN